MQEGHVSELCAKLRGVYGLHEFALLFGFDMDDDMDWTWHDVALVMAHEIEHRHKLDVRAAMRCDERREEGA